MIGTLPRMLLVVPALLSGLAAAPVIAQVAVDQGALEGLTPSAPAAPQVRPRRVQHPPARARAKPPIARTSPASTPTPAPTRPAPVVIPPAPPPPPASMVPVPPPAVHPASEIAIPMRPDAAGQASKIVGGLRVSFGAGSGDLNPTTEAALRSLARTVGADPAATFNVFAYAAGTEDDPSTPRRLSLSRALAVRAVLMSEGIASVRIYPRALGATGAAQSAEAPADRVDVTQIGIGAAAP